MNVCKKTFHISLVRICQKVSNAIMQNLQHIVFYLKTKTLVNFHICTSVCLSLSFMKPLLLVLLLTLMKLMAAFMTSWTLLGGLSNSFVADLLLSAFDTDTP